MEQKKTYVIRQIAYEFNDYTFDFVAEGGVEAYYHTYGNAVGTFELLEAAALKHALPALDKYPVVFNPDGTVSAAFEPKERDTILTPDPKAGDVNRFLCGRFYTISVFDTTPYFYVIETNRSHFKEEVILDLEGIPAVFPSYEEATNHIGSCLMDFNLYGTPEELSDMPALLQQLFDSHPAIFVVDEAWENKMQVNNWQVDPHINEVMKILFELLRDKPFTIKKVNIDHPALWNKK